MKQVLTLLVILGLAALAAGGAAVAPGQAASFKPQAANRGAEAITIPQMLSYQGKLTDTLGQPAADTLYAIRFMLYDQPTGGSPFWQEDQQVRTRRGLFSVLLGSVTPVGSVPGGGSVYLAMTVSGGPELTPRVRIVSAAYAYKADTANYALAASGGDNAWVRGGDSALYTVHNLGIARGGANNKMWGDSAFTDVNFGVACTTGASAWTSDYATVGGGHGNSAGDVSATVCGGESNRAGGSHASVGGGRADTATALYATIAGGNVNTASNNGATVGGGSANTASGGASTVGGGSSGAASGQYATVAGGLQDTCAGTYDFAAGYHSVVSSSYMNSAAFNGTTATASSQLRCGTLSKTGGSFTIDHPLDPYGKILNHYFVESPDMSNLYSGSVVLDASGRGEVRLPEYFDALNRNPRVQLTGVGTSDVYVAEDITGNRFVVGGKAGAKVYWQVTGDRKDQSAEVIRTMMPVEQSKTGPLAGRMLDDDFLIGCMQQLEQMGKAGEFSFRTAAGRQKYEKMQQQLEHPLH